MFDWNDYQYFSEMTENYLNYPYFWNNRDCFDGVKILKTYLNSEIRKISLFIVHNFITPLAATIDEIALKYSEGKIRPNNRKENNAG